MTNKQKEAALKAAKEAAGKAARKTEGMPVWARVLWVVYAALAGAFIAWLTGCVPWYAWEELTPEQRQAFQTADRAYHQWSGEPAPVTIAGGDK